jgi:hypothetical protein
MKTTFFSWKKKSFVQISSVIQKNKKNINNVGQIFKALPLNIYRREIVNTNTKCNSRISLKLDNINTPNGCILYSSLNSGNETTIINEVVKPDIQLNEISCITNCLNSQKNALNRVRSSGNIKRKFDTNNNTYYTNTNQYLSSRNKTFAQNQYNYLRIGNASLKPGTNETIQNVYSANGVTFCKKYTISDLLQNNTFKYRWLNGVQYDVIIPNGNYDIDSLNNEFQSIMTTNTHYYIENESSNINRLYLLNIVYDVASGKLQLQCYSSNMASQPKYRAASTSWSTYGGTQYNGYYANYASVAFIIPNTFASVVGFFGTYEPINNSTNASFLSNLSYGLAPLYRPVYYKPNNFKFAQQGAVSSTSLIARKKYENIITVASSYNEKYGSMSNILAYKVPFIGYSIKDKLGYPTTKTPIVSKNGLVKCEYVFRKKK